MVMAAVLRELTPGAVPEGAVSHSQGSPEISNRGPVVPRSEEVSEQERQSCSAIRGVLEQGFSLNSVLELAQM
jgi:hypothetical protein